MSAMDGPVEHRGVDAAEQAAAVMTAAGMPRMPARALMALVAAPAGGYTAAELADRLGVSPAAVSGAMKYLQQVHFIHRRATPGERTLRYALERDTFYASVTNSTPVYGRLADLVAAIADDHPDDDAVRDRATEMADFFRFLSARMPALIDEWRTARSS
ncbi:GbsR/MarR family transcriptional regulator [Microbacterium gorillae]|uniref:GbsR/MarR family transcriptional regulator n=1 Tax=Microbacterium gorillae TaxID=1231063 RepID=UPI00058C99E0|nr:MarR family transcriptional regulator [Microbacterium gorillae]